MIAIESRTNLHFPHRADSLATPLRAGFPTERTLRAPRSEFGALREPVALLTTRPETR